MARRADLNPPLGSPGGPCRVIQRIQDKVNNPGVRERLTQDVERGRSLGNPQAGRAYKINKEPVQAGSFDKVVIGPHAGYRMDFRTITVPVILKGVRNFVKADEYEVHETLARGKPVRWDDPSMRLTLVLVKVGPKTLKVVTSYWTGKKDPPAPGDTCSVTKHADGYREPASALPGVQTFVSNPDGTQKRDPQWLGSNPAKDKAHVAPKSRARNFPQPRGVNAPAPSGEGPDGKSLSQDKPRTLGQPGEDYGTPSLNWPQEGPHRRTMEADFFMERAPAPGPDPTLRYDRATRPLPLTHGEGEGHKLNNISPVTDAPGSAKVIPSGKGFVNKEAFRIGDVEALCSPDLRQKAKGLSVRLRRVDARNNQWLYDVQGTEPKPYRVKVKALPKRKNITDPKKVDILLSCSCPYWQWQGPEHHAKVNKYLFGKPRGTASRPDIKDPSGVHGACKHVLAVLQVIKGFDLPGRGRKTASLWGWGSAWIVVPRQETLIQRVARRYLEGRGEV